MAKETRRMFLGRFARAAVAAAIPVLNPQLVIPAITDRSAAIVDSILSGDQNQQEGDLSQRYYFELNGVTPSEKGNFKTSGGKDITWYNYTNLTVNASAIQNLYQYFEGLAVQARTGSISNGSRIIRFQTLPSSYKKIGVFIVDGGAPDPSWAEGNPSGAVTYHGYNGEINLTAIKTIPAPSSSSGTELRLFSTIEDYANFGILVEAAQGSFDVISTDQSTPYLAEEDFCNSYAFALYFKQKNVSYAEYIRQTSVRISVPGGISFLPIHLSENEYMNLPVFSALIKTK